MKFKLTVFLILLLLSLIVIFFNKSRSVSLFRNYLSETLRPFEIIFSKGRNAFLNIKDLKNLNAKLISENLELYGKLAKLSQLEKENSLLREKLNLADKNWNTGLARIIGRDFENKRSFLIDKGSTDGIIVGMPVILTGGIIIGKIDEVNSNNSKVRTIIDLQTKIAAIVSNKNISGLVRGLGSDLLFDLITKDKKPETGDLIVSSGTDGLWPRGLVIGKVKQVKHEDNQVFNTADIELLADFWDFNDVFVILNSSL